MICRIPRATLAVVIFLTAISVPAWPQAKLDKIKSEYSTVSSQLEKHIVHNWWIDDDPQSPELLNRQWSLAGEWVAAWLNAHPSAGAESLDTAISELAPTEEPGEHLSLAKDAFLMVAPGSIGNVFIVAKSNGHYRLAWSTAQIQGDSGEQVEILAAWHANNATEGGRGPYWAASGAVGSVIPSLGGLPIDGKGDARFYLDGTYAQMAGGTVGAQISLWTWDGSTARPLIAKAYTCWIDQPVRTRLEGDLLKVQQKKFFRTFFSCGMCEERQTDWIVRLTPDGIEDLGERSLVPELDLVDELFYRLINHKSAVDVAAPSAINVAARIVQAAKADHSEKQWKEFPTLGMIGGWKVEKNAKGKILCLDTDDSGAHLFALRSTGGKLFITAIANAEEDCAK